MFSVGNIPTGSLVTMVWENNGFWYTVYPTSAGGIQFISLDPGSNTPASFTVTTSGNGTSLAFGSGYVAANGSIAPGPVSLPLTAPGYALPAGLWSGVPFTGLNISVAPLSALPQIPFGSAGGPSINPAPVPSFTQVIFVPLQTPAAADSVTGPFQMVNGTCVQPSTVVPLLSQFMQQANPNCNRPEGCVFTILDDCTRDFVPKYCRTGGECGACIAVCPDPTKPCVFDTSTVHGPGTGTYSCNPVSVGPPSFLETYKVYIIILVVSVVLMLFGGLIFLGLLSKSHG